MDVHLDLNKTTMVSVFVHNRTIEANQVALTGNWVKERLHPSEPQGVQTRTSFRF